MLIILKASTRCNLHCRYCSGGHNAEGLFLGRETIRALAEQLPSLLRQDEPARFLWQGGEPTLLPPECFADMHGFLAETFSARGHPVEGSLQSNGLHISSRWLELLRHFDILPGISMDGPDFLHDAMRCTIDGQPTYARVAETLRTLQQAQFHPSLLCVVTKAHTRHVPEIVRWLQEWNLPIRFNPLLSCGRSEQFLPEADYFNFLREIYTLCAKQGIIVPIQPLEWMSEAVLLGKPPTECSYNGQCGKSIISLYPDGTVGTCGRGDVRCGNILHEKLSEIMNSPQWQMLRQRDEYLYHQCGQCEIWSWCHGGCPEVYGFSPNTSACRSRKDFFYWLGTDGIHILKTALLNEKKELQLSLHALTEVRKGLSDA